MPKDNEEAEITWSFLFGSVKDFARRYPEVGILFVLAVLWLILRDSLPSESEIGPALWLILLTVALPTAWVFLHRAVPRIFGNSWLWKLAEICTGAVVVSLTVCILLALIHFLLPNSNGGNNIGIVGRAYAFIFGDPETAITDTKIEPSILETEVSESSQAQFSPAVESNSISRNVDYSECIRDAHEEGNRNGIFECLEHLD